ncbi:hypothetical protein [Microvirga aerophila]|uniref:Uncharacterized protein n=1 Tax=Microvirga aerophila TaxID=670291 RepID=A0A512BRM4_9HYPH|nr:hypothetical protein [Microvirga aerophila]GEO14618.1 hypothetical protein MAE02_23140 [Microvirga aerophila]
MLLEHPHWEMVFQPKRVAYLNLFEPWWKIPRVLALVGGQFGSWDEMTDAVRRSTINWNAYRYPFAWGQAPPGTPLTRHYRASEGGMTSQMNHMAANIGIETNAASGVKSSNFPN